MDEKLEKIIKDIKKKFGEGAIIKLKDKPIVSIGAIATGCFSLDIALGINGIPRGRITEIYGLESSGKTTLASHIVAECQKKGGIVSYIDVEHALDPEYSKKIGVNVDDLLLSQPGSGEEALRILYELVSSNKVDLIIIDSIAALVPQAEIDGEIGEQKIALQARLMSSALRKLVPTIASTKTSVIFLNQIRMNIGGWGNPEVTPGGLALKFYSSIRIELRKRGNILKGEEVIGCKVKARITKNKVAPPFKLTEFDIYYDRGISYITDFINMAVIKKVIKKGGAWFQYKDIKWQGQNEVKEYLEKNPKILEEIKKEVIKLIDKKS